MYFYCFMNSLVDKSCQWIAAITTESRNILLRYFYLWEGKLFHQGYIDHMTMESNQLHLNPVLNSTESKRAAPDNLAPENNNKQPRGPVADVGSQSNRKSWTAAGGCPPRHPSVSDVFGMPVEAMHEHKYWSAARPIWRFWLKCTDKIVSQAMSSLDLFSNGGTVKFFKAEDCQPSVLLSHHGRYFYGPKWLDVVPTFF